MMNVLKKVFCGIAHILLVVIIGHNKLLEFLSFFFLLFSLSFPFDCALSFSCVQ